MLVQPANFKRLVTTSTGLCNLADVFPNHDILKKANIKEILAEITNSPEQKAYTRGVAMGFLRIPLSLTIQFEYLKIVGLHLERKPALKFDLSPKSWHPP